MALFGCETSKSILHIFMSDSASVAIIRTDSFSNHYDHICKMSKNTLFDTKCFARRNAINAETNERELK